MYHQMRAEYSRGDEGRLAGEPVKIWHMVRGEETTSMCGRELGPAAPTQSADLWATERAGPFCHSCGALYLREVP